ncbi:MAG: glycosyltransferase [Planctomycetota bacterium]|nr:MAG: glycosyltransferase [Planctomycetota bacterium]
MSGLLPLTVVVPVYHEEESIAETLARLRDEVAVPHDVLVVYDEEDDPTLPVVRGLAGAHPNVELVFNDVRRGVIGAIRKGFQVACERHGDDGAVLVVMADLSDDLAKVEAMHRMLEEGYDLVAGSRYSPGGEQHGGGWIKSRLSRLAGRSLAALTDLPTRDCTNAFRIYRTSFLRRVRVESTGGFELSLELTVKAWAHGFRVGEVPSVWRDREAGRSKFRLVAWLPRYLRWYLLALGHHYLGLEVGDPPAEPTRSWEG